MKITNRNSSWTQIKQFNKHLKLSISIIIITYSGWTWSVDVDTGYGRTEWNERDNLHIVACPRDKDEMRKFFFGHVFFCVFVRRCNNIQCPSDLLTFTTTSSDPASTFSYHILFLIAWSGTRPRIDLHWQRRGCWLGFHKNTNKGINYVIVRHEFYCCWCCC